jgi:adenylate kinase family enzyme
MVTARLSREDSEEKGWLLDGYPRSFAQAQSLEKLKIRPDVYIVLDVCEIYVYAIFSLILVIIHYCFPST